MLYWEMSLPENRSHYLSSSLERRLAHFKRKTLSDDTWVVAPLDVHVGPREGCDFICYR